MTLYEDIMPYFDKFIHVYGWNVSILWSPLKIWTPKNLTKSNLGTQFLNPGKDPAVETSLNSVIWTCHTFAFFFLEKYRQNRQADLVATSMNGLINRRKGTLYSRQLNSSDRSVQSTRPSQRLLISTQIPFSQRNSLGWQKAGDAERCKIVKTNRIKKKKKLKKSACTWVVWKCS